MDILPPDFKCGCHCTHVYFISPIHTLNHAGKNQAACFSWIIWGTTTFIVFLAQFEAEAGAGAWPIGVSGIITIYIAITAFLKRSDITITKTDWSFFVIALTSLPFWYFTSDPLWAVVILTSVDVLGFGPTVRKAYAFPFEEQLSFFALFMARNSIAILALENYTLTTVLFPAAMTSACLLLMVAYRRRLLIASSLLVRDS